MMRWVFSILAAAALVALPPPARAIPVVGGTGRIVLTSASPQTCTSIEVNRSGALATVINTGAAQTVFVQFYDEGANPTCANGDVIYGNGTSIALGLGQVITFNLSLYNGLAYRITGGPLGANVIVAYQ